MTGTPVTTRPVELDQLLQVAREIDDGAETPPCSEAEVVRDAAAEIERLRAALKQVVAETRYYEHSALRAAHRIANSALLGSAQ